jgi:hypothetical protein
VRGSLTCSFPGCERHPSKGDDIVRISAKGPGEPFIGRCREHLGVDVPADLEAAMDFAREVAPTLTPENPVVSRHEDER